MAIDNANLTDYVSLRRLKEYHDNVVLKAIETSGKVNDVGYGAGSNFTTYLKEYTDDNGNKKMRAEIPAANEDAAGLMTPIHLGELHMAVKSVTPAPSDAYKMPLISAGTLYFPNASTNGVTAGLLSNDDYKILKSVGEILGDAETSEGVIDTLYEVIDFLDQHASGTDLVAILNTKADISSLAAYAQKAAANEFTAANTFKNNVNFTGGSASAKINILLTNTKLTVNEGVELNLVNVTDTSKLPASAKYSVDSAGNTYYTYLGLGDNGEHGFKFNASNSSYSYYLPGLDDENVVDTSTTGKLHYRYLTTVMCFNNNATDPKLVISKSHLCECPPITDTMFA